MRKKLPKVFINSIDKEIKNNDNVFYSGNPSEPSEAKKKSTKRENGVKGKIEIEQKIRDIFNSKNYIYKASVVIKTKDGQFEKVLIGRNANNLITIDNEKIAINDVIDIDYAK